MLRWIECIDRECALVGRTSRKAFGDDRKESDDRDDDLGRDAEASSALRSARWLRSAPVPGVINHHVGAIGRASRKRELAISLPRKRHAEHR
jgi:hypothetical protein